MIEQLKQMLIRTPLERPVQRLRWMAGYPHRRKHPELHEIYVEADRVEDMLARMLRPQSNCIDVGCHLGSFLSLLLRLSPQGKHMAIEALPEKAERLKRKFTDVEVIHAAAGAEPGEITFYRNLSRSGFSGMTVHADPNDKIEEVKVQCARLDDLVPADRAIDFVKIDVEGNELSVLKGAAGLIARSRPMLLFECTLDGLKSADTTAEAIFDYLNQTLDYRVYLVKSWLYRAAPLNVGQFKKAMRYPFQAFNFVAAPADRQMAESAA